MPGKRVQVEIISDDPGTNTLASPEEIRSRIPPKSQLRKSRVLSEEKRAKAYAALLVIIFLTASLAFYFLYAPDDEVKDDDLDDELLTLRIGVDKRIVYEGGTISFEALNADPEAVSFSWDFNGFKDTNGDMNKRNDWDASTQSAQHTWYTAGDYEVVLKVVDSDGEFLTTSTPISVNRYIDINSSISSFSNIYSTEFDILSHTIINSDIFSLEATLSWTGSSNLNMHLYDSKEEPVNDTTWQSTDNPKTMALKGHQVLADFAVGEWRMDVSGLVAGSQDFNLQIWIRYDADCCD